MARYMLKTGYRILVIAAVISYAGGVDMLHVAPFSLPAAQGGQPFRFLCYTHLCKSARSLPHHGTFLLLEVLFRTTGRKRTSKAVWLLRRGV
jgi:hypothetical protein